MHCKEPHNQGLYERALKWEHNRTIGGILTHDELSGADGVHFWLFVPPMLKDKRKSAISEAKHQLLNSRDVTGFTIIRLQFDRVEICELSIEILSKTDDGNDLSSFELWEVEQAVNFDLPGSAVDIFLAIHEKYCGVNDA